MRMLHVRPNLVHEYPFDNLPDTEDSNYRPSLPFRHQHKTPGLNAVGTRPLPADLGDPKGREICADDFSRYFYPTVPTVN